MDHNCTVLREKSLKFFEGSKFKRDCEWTSSYFARENNDVLQRKDKDLNGNYGYLALTNKPGSSTEIICDNSNSPLSTCKQNGMPNGIPVLEQQGGHGTSDFSDVDLSQTCQVLCNDTSVISSYKDIKQVGQDVQGNASPREGYLASSLHREHFENTSSHGSHSSGNTTQRFEIPTNNNNNEDASSDTEKYFEAEPQRVVERVILWEKKSVACELNAKLTDTSSALQQGSQDKIAQKTSTVTNQAKSLTNKNLAQEDQIIPVSIQRQSAGYGDMFEETMTLEDEDKRYDDDDDEIVVIAVCDDGNDGALVAKAANDEDDDAVIIQVNNETDSVMSNNIRLTKWHDHDDCHEDDTNLLLGSYHGDDADGCHGDQSHKFPLKSDESNSQYDDDDNDDDDVNGGNPFDLNESEYQKLMQAIDDSFDSLLDDCHSDEPNMEHDTGNPLDSCDLTSKSTKNPLNEQDSIEIHHEEGAVIEEVTTPLDESKCNAVISDELCVDSEKNQDQDDGVNYGKSRENELEENRVQNIKFASSSSQVQTEELSSELSEVESSCVSTLENRTAGEIGEVDKDGKESRDPSVSANAAWLTEQPKDVTRLVKDNESQQYTQQQDKTSPFEAKNDDLLDDCVNDEVEENDMVAETTSNTVDELVKGDEINDEKEEKEEEKQEASIDLSSNMADVQMKENTVEEDQLSDDDQDQILETSTILKEDEDQKSIDGKEFLSLLVWHGIVSPQPSECGIHNEDPSGSTQDISVQERIENINKAFEWVRKELQEMRGVDFNLKVQFDGLRQEARFLRDDYEMFVNCEYYDDEEIFDEATEYSTCKKDISTDDDRDKGLDSKPLLHNALKEDSGYHSDTPSTSTDAGSTENDKPHHTTHAHAKYYYQPQPTQPKIQELNRGKCVFELVL